MNARPDIYNFRTSSQGPESVITMISIVIPAYNEQERIAACLLALSHQSIPRNEYEIIVVDGGSKDNTREIAAGYADKVFIQTSKRVGGARNDGISSSLAEIVATTDADSVVAPDWVEQVRNSFSSPSVVLAFGPVTTMEDTTKDHLYALLFNFLIWFGALTKMYYYTLGCNTAFRKEVFVNAGMYRIVDAGDDLEIAVRMRRKGKVVFNPNMKIAFDFRRYHEFGFLRTLYEWYAIVLQGGVSEKYTYTRKEYKNKE